MRYPSVSIIITNYNGEKYLSTCIKSVFNSNYKNFELIIFDDGSSDKSLEVIANLQNLYSNIKVYKNNRNSGAATGRNKVFKNAKGDVVVFLDNDTKVTPNWLHELVKTLFKEKEIGAAQALLVDFEKKDTIQMGGGLLVPYTAWLLPFFQGCKYIETRKSLREQNIVATSAAIAIKREVFKEVNGFDEKISFLTEDLDLSWRIWLRGYRIVLSPKAVIYHRNKTVEERRNMRIDYQYIYFNLAKNSFRSMLKNYEVLNVLWFLPISVLINLFRAFLVIVRRKDMSAFIGTLRALEWNILNLSDTLNSRRVIQKERRFSDSDLSNLIFTKENLIQIYNKHFRQTKLLW